MSKIPATVKSVSQAMEFIDSLKRRINNLEDDIRYWKNLAQTYEREVTNLHSALALARQKLKE